jgi:hypothetical protein
VQSFLRPMANLAERREDGVRNISVSK